MVSCDPLFGLPGLCIGEFRGEFGGVLFGEGDTDGEENDPGVEFGNEDDTTGESKDSSLVVLFPA